MTVWILLLFVGFSHGVYYGAILNYYPTRSSESNGTHLVELHVEMTTDNCSVIGGECIGANCTLVSTATEEKDPNSNAFCRTETTTVLQVPTDAPFEMRLLNGSQFWVDNNENVKLVRGLSSVDLRSRSDGSPNHPPQTAIMSPVRIPSNCARQMPLLAFDADDDQVLCRFASNAPDECDPCPPSSLSSSLTLTPTCILSFVPTKSTAADLYVIDLMMEDYPRHSQTFTSTSNNGTSETKGTSDFISRVPLQFILNLTSPVPSCAEGEYVPKFVAPTPEHGTRFYDSSGRLQIVIQAEATAAAIEGLLFSGPANVTEESQGNGRFVLTWTQPTSSAAVGRSYPLCFVARADVDSEIRCVILILASTFSYPFPTGILTTYYSSANDSLKMVTIRAKYIGKLCFTEPEYIESFSKILTCSRGDCGTQTLVGYFPVDGENNGEFCQSETVFTLESPSTLVFEASNAVGSVSVDLRIRSDTGRSNRPPRTTVPPGIRIPHNCARDYKILAFDEDGDVVKLCSSNSDNSGCNSCSGVTSHGTTFCQHSFAPTSFQGQIQISGYMKDFPKQNVTLTENSTSHEVRTPSDDFSVSIAVIYIQLDAPAPSCAEGQYLPQFTSNTPEFGEILTATVGEKLLIEVSAEANVSKVSELLFGGPHEMEKLTIGEGRFQLQWTPSEAEVEQSHPVCFLVDAVVGSRRYQTEPRCVVVKVVSTNSTAQPPTTAMTHVSTNSTAQPSTTATTTIYAPTNATTQSPATEPPTTNQTPSDAEGDNYVVALNLRLTSAGPLTDADVEDLLTSIKSALVAAGLPPETNLKKLSVSSS